MIYIIKSSDFRVVDQYWNKIIDGDGRLPATTTGRRHWQANRTSTGPKGDLTMKGKILTLTATLLMLAGSTAFAAPDPAKCAATFDKFMGLGNVPDLVAESYGYAVLPTIG